MLGLKCLITVCKREYTEEYIEFFNRHKVKNVLSILCNGTATDTVLDYLCIEKTQKNMFMTIIHDDKVEEIKTGLLEEMLIGEVGNGIAVFIPVDGLGGKSSLNYFLDDELVKKENEMENSKSVLIIAVVDKGNTETVMNSARCAGASGGTVIRAKGTGAELAKFFGIAICEEKELVYIVVKREQRDEVMHAIMNGAGINTDAHGIIFSLPVDSVIGIRGFDGI